MKKPGPSKDRRPSRGSGQLSEEDRLLWHHLARTLRPFSGRDRRISPVDFDDPHFLPHGAPPAAHGNAEPPQVTAARKPAPARHEQQNNPRRTPSLADFDSRKARKIRTGRIEIEARLDLHGMRQDEAHRILRAFLLRAQSRGQRWVLVITGKGAFARGAIDDDPPASGDWDTPQRGVLKRSVPAWLSEPDLRSVVVSFTTAAVHHGGEGALYIQLRSRNR